MYTIGSQRIYLELLLFAVIALSLMTYSFYFTNRIINTSGPLIEATEKIILETTLAHLRFEEGLSGDRHEDFNVVWRHLERADWYVQAILQGGENTTTTILPLENPLLRQQFREVLDKIATFRKVTEERFKLHTSKVPLTDITQRYHAVFSGFLAFADKVEEHVFEFTSKEIMVCRFVQWILVFIILFLFVMAGKIFIYHHRHQGEYTRLLEKEITERRRVENKIKQAYLEQQALAEIMRISLQPLTLQEMLEGALDVLLSSPLLKLEKKGSIFLARDGEDMLGLAVQNGFPSHLQVSCNILPFGRCLCGRAAENREIIFSSHLDERHEITYEGMQPHGHYCVPILTGNDHLLGVLNTYVEAGYIRNTEDEQFLKAAGHTLALAILNKRAEEALRKEKDKAQKYLDIAGSITVVIDKDHKVTLINRKGSDVLGYDIEQIVGMNWFDKFIPESIRDNVKAVFMGLMTGSVDLPEYFENPVLTKNGQERIVAWYNTIVRDDAGNIIGTMSSGEDITERKQAEEALLTSYRNMIAILNNMDSLVIITDMDTDEVLFLNEYGKKTFGDHTGKKCLEITRSVQSELYEFYKNRKLFSVTDDSAGVHVWQYRNTMNDRWYECRDQIMEWFDGRMVLLEIAVDITERKHDEEKVKYMAHHDMLTGLPNRILFMDRLEQAVVRCRRDGTMMAVMFLDLDNFKQINDSMGHAIGDRILKLVSERLLSCMRETDTVARFGGDEFIVLMTGLKNSEPPAQMVQKLKAVISAPIDLDNNEFTVGVSIGIALYPEHAKIPEKLIALADEAMYEVKRKTSNGYPWNIPHS